MTHYLAITLGPLDRTTATARRTREIWLASYVFSHLAKCICDTLPPGTILIPKHPTQQMGFGVYPDQLIARFENSTKPDADFIQKALLQCCNDLGLDSTKATHYFHVHSVWLSEVQLNEIHLPLESDNASPIHKLKAILQTQDKQNAYHINNPEFLDALFSQPHILRKAYDAAQKGSKFRYPSLRRIAAADQIESMLDLLDKLDDEEKVSEQELIQLNALKKYHNYVAVLHADGDYFGKVISAIGNNREKIGKFTAYLDQFASNVAKTIHQYGGQCIYIGGDDIMCFAPVSNANLNQNIFDLIQNIRNDFQKIFSVDPDYQNVSLSFGLTLTYVKYPMAETIERSRQLMYEAKNQGGRNALALELMLHSGQTIQTILHFGDATFENFKTLLKNFDKKEELLSSLIHSFVQDESMLKSILQANAWRERLHHFMHEKFDHQTDKVLFVQAAEEFICHLKEIYCPATTDSVPINDQLFTKLLQTLNAVFRIVKFMSESVIVHKTQISHAE